MHACVRSWRLIRSGLKFSKYLFLGKAGPKKKGRPTRDSSYLLHVNLTELKGAKAGCTKYFGPPWAALRRTVLESMV